MLFQLQTVLGKGLDLRGSFLPPLAILGESSTSSSIQHPWQLEDGTSGHYKVSARKTSIAIAYLLYIVFGFYGFSLNKDLLIY